VVTSGRGYANLEYRDTSEKGARRTSEELAGIRTPIWEGTPLFVMARPYRIMTKGLVPRPWVQSARAAARGNQDRRYGLTGGRDAPDPTRMVPPRRARSGPITRPTYLAGARPEQPPPRRQGNSPDPPGGDPEDSSDEGSLAPSEATTVRSGRRRHRRRSRRGRSGRYIPVPKWRVGKFPRFTGEQPAKGTDYVTYQCWRFNVLDLLDAGEHDPRDIFDVAWSGLVGEAANTVTRTGKSFNRDISALLEFTDARYGGDIPFETMKKQWHLMRQAKCEDPEHYLDRVQDHYNEMARFYPEQMAQGADGDWEIRTRYFEGLMPFLRSQVQHLQDDARVPLGVIHRRAKHRYQEMLDEEQEKKRSYPSYTQAPTNRRPRGGMVTAAPLEHREQEASEPKEDAPTLTDLLPGLTEEMMNDISVAALAPILAQVALGEPKPRLCYYCSSPDHMIKDCPSYTAYKEAQRAGGTGNGREGAGRRGRPAPPKTDPPPRTERTAT